MHFFFVPVTFLIIAAVILILRMISKYFDKPIDDSIGYIDYISGGDSVEDMPVMLIQEKDKIETMENGLSSRIYKSEAESHRIMDSSKKREISIKTKAILIEAMESTRIVKKIRVSSDSIMKITAQTNLLALNAAIEAERAGESGKDILTVASEISKIAEETKNTVGEIKAITKKANDSVTSITEKSDKLIDSIPENTNGYYIKMLNLSHRYSEDTACIEKMIKDFSIRSEELLVSVRSVINSIDEVTEVYTKNNKCIAEIRKQ